MEALHTQCSRRDDDTLAWPLKDRGYGGSGGKRTMEMATPGWFRSRAILLLPVLKFKSIKFNIMTTCTNIHCLVIIIYLYKCTQVVSVLIHLFRTTVLSHMLLHFDRLVGMLK